MSSKSILYHSLFLEYYFRESSISAILHFNSSLQSPFQIKHSLDFAPGDLRMRRYRFLRFLRSVIGLEMVSRPTRFLLVSVIGIQMVSRPTCFLSPSCRVVSVKITEINPSRLLLMRFNNASAQSLVENSNFVFSNKLHKCLSLFLIHSWHS